MHEKQGHRTKEKLLHILAILSRRDLILGEIKV